MEVQVSDRCLCRFVAFEDADLGEVVSHIAAVLYAAEHADNI